MMCKHAQSCGAKYPDQHRSTALLKYVAVLSQVINLKNNDLDVLSRFMGHAIRTPHKYYHLPEQTIQQVNVLKFW